MRKMLLLFAIVATTVATSATPRAETAIAGDENPFGFQYEETHSHRGVGVEGYVYSALPWRITNVQLQVDSLDANGTLIASASGWVLGDVPAHGRGYFYVSVSTPATTYRPTVQTYNKVAPETPALQAP
jgi:hypothetical protein